MFRHYECHTLNYHMNQFSGLVLFNSYKTNFACKTCYKTFQYNRCCFKAIQNRVYLLISKIIFIYTNILFSLGKNAAKKKYSIKITHKVVENGRKLEDL